MLTGMDMFDREHNLASEQCVWWLEIHITSLSVIPEARALTGTAHIYNLCI